MLLEPASPVVQQIPVTVQDDPSRELHYYFTGLGKNPAYFSAGRERVGRLEHLHSPAYQYLKIEIMKLPCGLENFYSLSDEEKDKIFENKNCLAEGLIKLGYGDLGDSDDDKYFSTAGKDGPYMLRAKGGAARDKAKRFRELVRNIIARE